MEKVGIIGSGLMGTGIAFVVARQIEGETVVVDVDEKILEKSRRTVEGLAARAVEKGQATQEEAGKWLKRLNHTTDRSDLKGAAFIIEAVPEDLALKCRLFTELSEICAQETILASNTSGLPITQIAAGARHPERVIGTHFFNPAPVMKLVEIVRGYATSETTIQKTRGFCSRLGKESILVEKDYPGFITTRIGNGYLAEALRCLEEGVGSAGDIDKGCRLAYNYPMGPFELMDLVGLDTVLRVFESLHQVYGERFRPSPLLRQMVSAGRLGRKSGSGFYNYAKKEKGA
ncbi:MAG: 3-hydroxyacyl-CoA dehydrogenase family protein [Deltaproteobacteria bacterium]|nr:3-hydroxyacyl-CoA dehydrogenase family protein [Deltaproteobacteria bacterium]